VSQEAAPTDGESRTVRIEISPKSVLLVVGTLIGVWLVTQVWPVLLMLVVASVLAGALNPLLDWLDGHGVRRPFALGLMLALLIGAVVGIGALVVPALMAQVESIAAGLPELQARLAARLAPLPYVGERAGAALAPAISGSTSAATPDDMAQALPLAMRILDGVTVSLTTVMLAFYLLADRERVVGFIYALLPRHFHVRTARILLDLERVVGGYVRGQGTTSGLIGLYTFTLLWLVGAPNPLALGLLASVADAIPFLGPFIVLIPAVAAALSVGPPQAGIAFIALVLYQEIENRILVPRVYGSALRLSPVAVIVAVLVGGKLLGLVGAILALPIAAGIRVFVEDLRIELPGGGPWRTYRARRRAPRRSPVRAAHRQRPRRRSRPGRRRPRV
jgi:putative heme transporter